MLPTRRALVERVEGEPLTDPRVAAALEDIDRAGFVPPALVEEAYEDHPVPLPEGQTTSQPTLIARMIDAVVPPPQGRVLEIGTGYGFQTAWLAKLCTEVISIDRHPSLVEAAGRNLSEAGITNVTLVAGDGTQGWPNRQPYDAVIVSAAADSVPSALIEQLAEGGRLVIPLRRGGSDDVVLFVKEGGRLRQVRLVTPARFVPLITPGPREGEDG